MTPARPGQLSLLEERDALVDALVSAQDRMSALEAMLRVRADTLDLDEVTRRMLTEALELVESDVVVLGGADGRARQQAARRDDASTRRLHLELDERLSTMEVSCEPTWALTALPSSPDVGIAVGRLQGPPYTTGDLRMLQTVALAVEQFQELSRLHQELVRQTVVEKAHQLASRLAQAVLPTTCPCLPGVEVFARCTPASLAGGDFMVFAEVGDVLWVAVGDVAGKGLPAAMIMIQAVAALRVAMRVGDPADPGAVVGAVGRDLQGYLDSVESFVTLAVAVHRRGSGSVALSNAGHSPVVSWEGPGSRPRNVRPTSPPLGVDVGRLPGTVSLALPPGARLVIGTDGLVEQPDPHGEMIGYDAFVEACASPAASATELGERLMTQVETHADGTPAADDRTLVVLGAIGSAGGRGDE